MGDMPAWMSGKGRKQAQNRRSAVQERRRAAETGGTVRAGSGSSWRAPQDNVTADAMEQVKYTDASSFTIKAKDIQQVRLDALRHGRDPRMVVELSRHNVRLIIIIEDT